MEDEKDLRTISKVQCGGCQKYFSSNGTFDQHRVSVEKGVIGSARRCMTTEEMQEAGMAWEWLMVGVMYENKRSKEKHEVWYDPAAREKMREAFRKGEQEDADED